MPPVEFELTISAAELPQTYVLDCAATGTGNERYIWSKNASEIYIYIYIYITFRENIPHPNTQSTISRRETHIRATTLCLKINKKLLNYSFIKLFFIVQNGWFYFGSLRKHSTSATLAPSLSASQYGLVKSVLLDLRNKDEQDTLSLLTLFQ